MKRNNPSLTVALCGNPNVGKSTLFQRLTGIRQHTGNWAGKTVEILSGAKSFGGTVYRFIDLPGTYSLSARSPEEEIARDFILSGEADVICIVIDGTNPFRNLYFALSAIEIGQKCMIAINLTDEAEKRGIYTDTRLLSEMLSVPVAAISARSGRGIKEFFKAALESHARADTPHAIPYPEWIEEIISAVCDMKKCERSEALSAIWAMDSDTQSALRAFGKTETEIEEEMAAFLNRRAHEIAGACVNAKKEDTSRALTFDRILTGRRTWLPFMAVFVSLILFITIYLSNAPSEYLSRLFRSLDAPIRDYLSVHSFTNSYAPIVTDGIYRITSWVIAVMLPPMAIFFPLFSLLEESGVFPRIAFNLDGAFQKCCACGKQCLTMCMGLGCNCVGITGARIIDSPRERLIAILTNTLMPCNGRFPTLIALTTIFIAKNAFLSAAALSALIALSVITSFFMSFVLSKTVLRGKPSFFAMEIPPYRRPPVVRCVLSSLINKTFRILVRAVLISAPAGALIWLFSNVTIGSATVTSHMTAFLDPAGKLLGMDGVMLTAFILSFPANEITLPLALMIYSSSGVMPETGNLTELKHVLIQNGWTIKTAMCALIFTLMHWPCSASLVTVYKETKSALWTLASALIPLIPGCILCMAINFIA